MGTREKDIRPGKTRRIKVGTSLDKHLLEKIRRLALKEKKDINELIEEAMMRVIQSREGQGRGDFRQ